MPKNNPAGYLEANETFGGFSDPRLAAASTVPGAQAQNGGPAPAADTPADSRALSFDPVSGLPTPPGTGGDPTAIRYFRPPTADPDFVDPWQPADAPARHPRWQGFGRDEWEASPLYQHILSEGEKAIRRGHNAHSGVLSGTALKDLERFRVGEAARYFDKGRDYAQEDYVTEALEFDKGRKRGTDDRMQFAQDYQNSLAIEQGKRARYIQNYEMNAKRMEEYWNRLSRLSGTGQVVTTGMIDAGRSFLSEMAGAQVGGAQALGGGAINAAQAKQIGGQQGLNNILASIGMVAELGGIFGWW